MASSLSGEYRSDATLQKRAWGSCSDPGIIWIDGGAAVKDISSTGAINVLNYSHQFPLTKALEPYRIAKTRLRLAGLGSLPDAPAADVFNFIARRFLDIAPLEYGNANSLAQVIHVKHFAKINITRIKAAGNSMRRSEWANDGYTLGQHCKIDKVSLGTLRHR